ncbi:hypothetical protein [Marinilabilia sp.]|uniref:hypothetical protein n=1 Tax=Marinilabilia sp. TaxID=2021252 RepID=UPI0025C10221|nr:hypothetical protein [Marinilabilia sp.]
MKSRLFYFNPTNEMAIANGEVSYMPPRHLHHFEMDMTALPWLLGTENDFVLARQKEGNSISHLEQFDWGLPTLVSSPDELPAIAQNNLWFSPWGWSPAVYRHFRPYLPFSHPQWDSHPFAKWEKRLAETLSRETSYLLLNAVTRIKNANPEEYALISLPEMPMEIYDEENLPDILRNSSPPLIVKTPFSASGRGLFRIRNQEDAPEKSQWVKGMLKRQGKIYVEKMLNKIQDVSFQFYMNKEEITFLGHNFFYTEPSGQFAGCAIGEPETPSALFRDQQMIYEAIAQASELLQEGMKKITLNHRYTGPAGVDGIFIEDERSRLKLQPCLEINLRYNMGYANVLLKQKMHPLAKGTWKTGIFAKEGWQEFCENEAKKNPVKMLDAKPIKGFIPLVNPSVKKLFGAWLHLK